MYQDRVNAPVIAGLVQTQANPVFSKDTFKMFIPSFGDWIDMNDGEIETVINLATVDTPITDTIAKIDFLNDFLALTSDLSVLNIDSNNDVILGKNTESCYTDGYNVLSNITLTDTSGLDNEIYITYSVDGLVIKVSSVELTPLEQVIIEIDFDLSTAKLNSVLTVSINDNNNASLITYFNNTVKSNFKAADGDASALYESFCGTANNKILKLIWNSDWDYAMSLCIAHYLAIVNTETQRSFGLEDLGKNNDPKGLVVTDLDKIKYDYKSITLSRNAAKFWQATEFGRILITLLDTKSILTMIVVN